MKWNWNRASERLGKKENMNISTRVLLEISMSQLKITVMDIERCFYKLQYTYECKESEVESPVAESYMPCELSKLTNQSIILVKSHSKCLEIHIEQDRDKKSKGKQRSR